MQKHFGQKFSGVKENISLEDSSQKTNIFYSGKLPYRRKNILSISQIVRLQADVDEPGHDSRRPENAFAHSNIVFSFMLNLHIFNNCSKIELKRTRGRHSTHIVGCNQLIDNALWHAEFLESQQNSIGKYLFPFYVKKEDDV